MNDQDVLQQIIHVLASNSQVQKIYLYGSRSNHSATNLSDYDIAVETKNMEPKEFNLLALDLQENVMTLHKIDLVHMNQITNQTFLSNIKKGQIIYQTSS